MRLFDRRQRGYSLTSGGEALLAYALEIERQVMALSLKVGGQDQRLSGSISVTTVDDLWTSELAPVVAAFQMLHPGVGINLAIHSDFVDLARQQADIAMESVLGLQMQVIRVHRSKESRASRERSTSLLFKNSSAASETPRP